MASTSSAVSDWPLIGRLPGATTAAEISAAALNLQNIDAHAGDLFLDEFAGTLPQRHHGDHGRNADDDSSIVSAV
jgi:hypothetical protein